MVSSHKLQDYDFGSKSFLFGTSGQELRMTWLKIFRRRGEPMQIIEFTLQRTMLTMFFRSLIELNIEVIFAP